MKQKRREVKKPTFVTALIPFVFMVIALYVGIAVYQVDPHIPLMLSAAVAAIVSMHLGFTWKSIEKGMFKAVSLSLQAIMILMIIGSIIGSWIAGGIVLTMIYYGLELLSPSYFLVAACAISSIVALASGNAWTAAGTIGIAIMGIRHGLGINPEMVAGAVISGVYLGDKVSPLSETINLAPGITGAELFEHIKHMLYTTIPAFIIALIIYAIIGLKYIGQAANITEIEAFQTHLNTLFVISPWLLIVPGFVIFMLILKVQAIPGLIIGSLLGVLATIYVQGGAIGEAINVLYYGFSMETGIEIVDSLLNNDGIESMLYTVSLILITMSFGGILETTGILETIVQALLKFAKSTGSLITTTAATCIFANIVACDQYLSIVLPSRMYAKAYRRKGLHPKNLSRTLEDAGTMTSPLVPWNTLEHLCLRPSAFLL